MASVIGTANSDILNADDGITSGDDTVSGGDGNDTIRGLGGNDYLYGEDGRDTIYGGDGIDVLDGGKNEDSLFGGNDNDYLFGQKGDDKLYGESNNDYLDGGAGADRLDGGDGIDVVSYYLSDEGVHVSLSPFHLVGSGNWGGDAEGDTLFSIENLSGSKYDDELYGDGHANLLWGNEGNDVINGGGGGDHIYGGDGIDTVSYEWSPEGVQVSLEFSYNSAGDHLDSIECVIGSDHADYLTGDDGDNTLNGLGGPNNLSGHGGNDVLWGGEDNDTLLGGDGTDVLKGFGGDDTLDGGTFLGDNGVLDAGDILNDGDQPDTMWGGTGDDTYVVDHAADVVTEFAGEGSDTVYSFINYTLGDNVEDLDLANIGGLSGTGNDLDNFIYGNDYPNLLNGGGGADIIYGLGGDDIIDGGTNADTMVGGQGFDFFIVDDVNDVVLENVGDGIDQVQTSVSYALAAQSEVEVLYADQTTTAAINLVGNEFDNFVTGNDGVNIIAGGVGLDTLRGEGSGDVFLWSSVAESEAYRPDIVVDFNRAEGDLLHFTNMDADETKEFDQNFTFIGTDAFTGPGQINWFTNGTDTFIQLNTNTDSAAESVIQVNGVQTVDASWFFL
jgi:Ca2+-binding RTX toxin-like protein